MVIHRGIIYSLRRLNINNTAYVGSMSVISSQYFCKAVTMQFISVIGHQGRLSIEYANNSKSKMFVTHAHTKGIQHQLLLLGSGIMNEILKFQTHVSHIPKKGKGAFKQSVGAEYPAYHTQLPLFPTFSYFKPSCFLFFLRLL